MGRRGNSIFQYVYARLLAVRNNLYLKTKFPFQNLLKTTRHEPGRILEHPTITIIDGYKPEGKKFFYQDLVPAHYIIQGWFQEPDFYNRNEELIRSFFVLKEPEKNTEDIIMAVRLGDYARLGWLVHPEWYLRILEGESFKKLYIVGSKLNEPYLKYFKKYKPIIVPTSTINDFCTVRKFDKIICSNSSLIWWAAFFSRASRIYTFARWIDKKNKKKYGFLFRQSFLKNAIRVDGKFLTDYTPKTYYPVASVYPGWRGRLVKKKLKEFAKKVLVLSGILPHG